MKSLKITERRGNLAKKGGLGKGLDALFEDSTSVSSTDINSIRISEIEPNLTQPRKTFNEESLTELADSIAAHGVLQPLLVRPMNNGMYQIVAGERRWRAARMAGLSEVPVLIKELSDEETDKIALIENLQREDLNILETAQGYQKLMEKYGMTQEDLSESVGKSRSSISNSIRILSLPKEVIEYISNDKLSAGHAKAILSAPEEKRLEIAKKVIAEGLSVRQTEKLASSKTPVKKPSKVSSSKNNFIREMQIAISGELGREIKITGKESKGKIQIPFYSKEELSSICKQLEKIKK